MKDIALAVNITRRKIKMKAYKIELLIIDHDCIGGEDIKTVLEDARYPNHCISPNVMDIKEVDIGEWHDDHPLNLIDQMQAAYKQHFQ